MMSNNDTGIVWIVSFEIDEAGRFLNYDVAEFDLDEHPGAAEKLSPLIGKGVFKSSEEARLWAEKQFSSSSAGCQGCGGGGCQGKPTGCTGDKNK